MLNLIIWWSLAEQWEGKVEMKSLATVSVPGWEHRPLYSLIHLVIFAPSKTGVLMVPSSGMWLCHLVMVRAKNSINCHSLCRWQHVALADGLEVPVDLVMADDPVLFQGSVLVQLAEPLDTTTVEVDRVWSLDSLICTATVVWWSDCGVGGEWKGIGDLRSISSLWDVGRGVVPIGALVEVSSFCHSCLSPASPPLAFFCLSFLPGHSSLKSYFQQFPFPQLAVSSLALFILLPISSIPFLSTTWDHCLFLNGSDTHVMMGFIKLVLGWRCLSKVVPSVRLVPIVPVSGPRDLLHVHSARSFLPFLQMVYQFRSLRDHPGIRWLTF